MRLDSYKPIEVEDAMNELKASDKQFMVFHDMEDKFRVMYKKNQTEDLVFTKKQEALLPPPLTSLPLLKSQYLRPYQTKQTSYHFVKSHPPHHHPDGI